MKKIIIDTNFLMIPGEFRVDIFSEIKNIANFPYKLAIIDKTIDELKMIISRNMTKSTDKLYAKIGLGLIESQNIEKIHTQAKNVDDAIVEIADEDTLVATSDKELKKRLREKNVRIINLRKKQYLKIDG